MAEYIDKVKAMNIIAGGKNDNAYFGTTSKDWEVIDFLKTVPTADVIERSKIDNAIDELRKEIEENHLNVIEYADGEWIVKDFVYGAIERFKRNIGE